MEISKKLLRALRLNWLVDLIAKANPPAPSREPVGRLRSITELREAVKAAEAEGRALRAGYRALEGGARHQAWLEVQRHARSSTRPLLLAYAFVRGVPYRMVEQKTRSNLIDLEFRVAAVLLHHEEQKPVCWKQQSECRPCVREWLNGNEARFAKESAAQMESPACASTSL